MHKYDKPKNVMKMKNHGCGCVELLAIVALVSGCGANAPAGNADSTESALNAAPLELTIGTNGAHQALHNTLNVLNVNVDSRTPAGALMTLPFRRSGDSAVIQVNLCPDAQKTYGKHLPNYSPPRIALNLHQADCEMVWNALVATGEPDVVIYGENGWPATAVNSYAVGGQTIIMEAPMALPSD